jgi:superfamily II DNA helicase RecQ
LELGIDVGDLDRVVQIDAPGSVSAFLQRMGRTGRELAPSETAFSSQPLTRRSSKYLGLGPFGGRDSSSQWSRRLDQITSLRNS